MKDQQVKDMFNRIAFSYDFQNSALSMRQDAGWRKKLARMLDAAPGDTVLDAAVGTGEVALEILRQRPGVRVAGVDFSTAMLEKARLKKPLRFAQRLHLLCGDCRLIPLRDNSVQCATMAFGLRNIEERHLALKEIFRVLRPGGQLHIMEFGIPDNLLMKRLYRFYFDHILPPVGNMLSKTNFAYSYLVESVDAFPGDAEFLNELTQAGFEPAGVTNLTYGVAKIFSGKKQ